MSEDRLFLVRSKFSLFFILSLFFGVAITLYMRFILHDGTVWALDEGNYLEIITKLQSGRTFPLSGPLYIWVVEQVQWIQDASLIKSLPFFALISASVLPAFFFLFYYYVVVHEIFNPGLADKVLFAFLCILMLLSSSHFIWSMIEGRPQQLGFLLMLVVLYLYYRQLLHGSFFQLAALFLLSAVLFYYHILSFIFFICIASMLWFWFYINRQCSFLSILLPVIIIISSVFVFTEAGGVYFRLYRNLFSFHLKDIDLQLAGIGICLLMLAAFLLQKLILKVVSLVKNLLSSKYFVSLLILLSLAALMIQLYLLGADVLYFYRESKLVFIIFQLGNMFFLVCYFYGLHYLSQQNKLDNFFVIASVLFLILAVCSIFISFYLGDKNLLMRLLSFWVLLAAPVAGVAFIKFYQFHRGFLVVLVVAIVLSIILSSKSGRFFNFEFFWDKNDIDAISWACQNPGDYKITHTERQLKHFAKEENYARLKNILCPKTVLSLFTSQQACSMPVYQKGYVEICSY